MALANHLKKLEAKFPVSAKPELGACVHWAGVEQLPVHRWFRYREGYSPLLFSHFKDSRSRFDPFCGCGTTLLSSSVEGIDSFGLDLSPLATFVAKVKTRRYTAAERKAFATKAVAAVEEWRNCVPFPSPSYPLLVKLFQPEILDTLLRLKSFIQAVSSEKVESLLKLAWLSILEDTSNVFKEGNGLKYRNKRRRPGKYITIPDREWIPKYFGDDLPRFVIDLWKQKCLEITSDLGRHPQVDYREPEVRTGSCFEPDNLDFDRRADLAIFSPPYANRFDYFEAFKIELWMGDFVKTTEDMAALRGKSMRSNLSAPRLNVAEWHKLSPFLDAMDEEASSVRMGIKTALAGYFDDMRNLLKHLKMNLTRNGKVVIVVGNSAYAKSIIPTDLLICEVAAEEGYRIQAMNVARSLHVSSQQRNGLKKLEAFMRESVIVLRR
jgi:site-specific DNA-methyltransferase (adenine-specific)